MRDNFDLGTTVRFALVGILSTSVYFGVTFILTDSHCGVEMWLASVIGFAASIMVSYFGHVAFTYRLQGNHLNHGFRFLVVVFGLSAAFSILVQVLNQHFSAERAVWIALPTLLFPPASFVLHSIWSFAAPRDPR